MKELYCKYNHDNVDLFLIDVSSMFNACKLARLKRVGCAFNTITPSLRELFTRLKRLFMGWKRERLFTALTWFLQNSEFIFDHMTHF